MLLSADNEILTGLKILCVDDISTNLEVLNDLLMNEGYKVFSAPSGEIALRILEKAQPDLILLDIMMPGIDGYETAQRIKRVKNFKETPIIFLSAKDDEESVEKGFEIGAVDYVSKPFRRGEILARIRTHLFIRKKFLADNQLIRELEKNLETQEVKLLSYLEKFGDAREGKDDFLVLLAQEIKAPLNILKGTLELLKSDLLSVSDGENLKSKVARATDAQVQIFQKIENFIDKLPVAPPDESNSRDV